MKEMVLLIFYTKAEKLFCGMFIFILYILSPSIVIILNIDMKLFLLIFLKKLISRKKIFQE